MGAFRADVHWRLAVEPRTRWALELREPEFGGLLWIFGFTGAHFHRNWANDDFRKTVLNAILWTAKVEVPEAGVASSVTPEQLKQNLDAKGERRR